MTVGENIQKYRKALGLSQEELGQKLLVSRQTISLWEKGQTVPTIDNLMRLSDIFEISVDEILSTESKDPIVEIEPNEFYRFTFSKQELNEIYRLQRNRLYKRAIIFALLSILMTVFFIESSVPDNIVGFFVGIFFIGAVSHIKGIRTHRKNWKNSTERISKSTYEYKVFEEYLRVSIYRENEKIRESKCLFTDIEKIQQFGNWLFLQFGGQSFIIRKCDLQECSAIYSYMQKNPSKAMRKTPYTLWQILSVLLFVASLLSIFGAMALIGVVSNANHFFVENLWLFFLLTPIPISSIILGFILKAKHLKYKKNIIVGIIMTAALCLYGSFSFLLAGIYDHSDTPIVRTEQAIGMDIPQHKQISTQDWSQGKQSVSRGYIYFASDIYFDNSEVAVFESQLANDDRWLSSVSNDLIGITSPIHNYRNYDYSLIFNVDTAQYNTLPSQSGTYRFIHILYELEENQMIIVEYDMDYVK